MRVWVANYQTFEGGMNFDPFSTHHILAVVEFCMVGKSVSVGVWLPYSQTVCTHQGIFEHTGTIVFPSSRELSWLFQL